MKLRKIEGTQWISRYHKRYKVYATMDQDGLYKTLYSIDIWHACSIPGSDLENIYLINGIDIRCTRFNQEHGRILL